MKMPFNQVFNVFHLQTNKKFPKEVKRRLHVTYLNLPTTDFLFLCYLQQLFIRSGSANHRLKITILVTHIVFHLTPLTLQTKKMPSTSEKSIVSEVSHQTLFCFHATAKYKPLRVRFRKKISLMLLFVQVNAQFHWWCCKMKYTCFVILCDARKG